jgi:hypothetical protein
MATVEAVAVALSMTAALMLWKLLRRIRLGGIINEESEYSGSARNPDALMSVDDQAIKELDTLLGIHGEDMEE